MSSVNPASPASSVQNRHTSNPINRENEPPSAEQIRHLIEKLNTTAPNLAPVQRNITINRAAHSQIPNPNPTHLSKKLFNRDDLHFFTTDHNSIEKLYSSLSKTTSLHSFEKTYRRYIHQNWRLLRTIEERIEFSVIAFLHHDISLEKLVEINTFTARLAEIFIDRLGLQLQLPSGRVISLDYFFTDPLFRNIPGPNIKLTFVKLFLLTNLPEKYDEFFSNLNNKNWFEPYTSKPEELALISLVAFLDGKIKREELFIMHLASAAFDAAKSKSWDVAKAECEFVEADRIAEFLEKSGYPPFAANTTEHVISNHNRKQGVELEKEIEKLVSKYRERSNVEKTFVKYTLKNFHYSTENRCLIEMSIYYKTNTRIGFENVVENDNGTVILGPPEFIIELYRSASSISSPPASAHSFMFGFSRGSDALRPLYAGVRPISIASVLFFVPLVHNFPGGVSLGTTKHDLDYHIPLDGINSHIDIFTEIACRIRTHAKSLNKDSMEFKICKEFQYAFLDREANGYRFENDQRSSFWTFVRLNLNGFNGLFKNADFLRLFENVIYPTILDVVSESDKDIYMPTLEQVKEAIQNYKV